MQNKQTKGITLISLVITIIILLILARSNNSNSNRRQWNINNCSIRKCYNEGTIGNVENTISQIGGIVGDAEFGSSIDECYNKWKYKSRGNSRRTWGIVNI